MDTFANWSALPAEIRSHLDALENFINDLEGQDTDDGTIDGSDAVQAVNGLVAEIARLRAALVGLDAVLDFGAPAVCCECFPDPGGLDNAMQAAREALGK